MSNVQEQFIGKEYALNSGPQRYWGDLFLSDIQNHNKYINNLLDVGCGDGYFISKLSFNRAIGLDLSTSMIEYAKNIHNNLRNVEWICDDLVNVNLKMTFDIIICFSVLHWVNDIKSALVNIYNHLCKDGRIYIILAAQNDDSVIDKSITQELIKNNIIFNKISVEYSLKEFQRLCTDCGFNIIKGECKEITYMFKDKNEFINYLKTVLSIKNKDDIYLNIVNNYIEMTNQKDILINYTDKLLYFILEKKHFLTS